ncbi:4817_t:CDS:2, partial [Funneliformis mosseae]
MTLNSSSKTTATTEIRRNGINTQNCSPIFNEQDHLPLSHIQEKLKGDDAPLNVDSFLIKPIQSRHTTPTFVITSNDAVIGRIMNLVDTIGVDSTQGTTQETENTSSENPIENVTEKDGSKDNSKEEPIVFMNARENRIESMTEGLINFDEIISDNLKLSSNESAEEKDNT